MTEFEEIDGELVKICDHEWSNWLEFRSGVIKRWCHKCDIEQILSPKPSPLPTKSKFRIFLAGFKAKLGL